MPAPRAITGQLAAIRDAAEKALARPDGLKALFLTSEHGSLERASAAARRFQQAFSSIRAKERRLKQRHITGSTLLTLDATVTGRYDALSCWRDALDNDAGFSITLARAMTISTGFSLVDLTTGEPLDEVTKDEKRLSEVSLAFVHEHREAERLKRRMTDPLDEDVKAWVWAFNPVAAFDLYVTYGLRPPWPEPEGYREFVADMLPKRATAPALVAPKPTAKPEPTEFQGVELHSHWIDGKDPTDIKPPSLEDFLKNSA